MPGMRLQQCIHIEDLRLQAKRRLPRMVFDFLDGGAEDEVAVARNRSAFNDWQWLPRRLVDVSHCAASSASRPAPGTESSLPLGLAPTGLNGMLWPQGDLQLARAAQRHGISFALSTAANLSITDLARQLPEGDHWFQLYVLHRELAEQLVKKALQAGYRTLVLTVDVPVNGKRERDLRSGFSLPLRPGPGMAWDILTHPRWALAMARHGSPVMAQFAEPQAGGLAWQAALMARQMDASFDWQALQALRASWPHRLLVKGILHPEDARHCQQLGVDGIIVSNHGGRQLDHAISPLQALPGIVEAVQLPIWLDGGVRRGSDVLKALALGASAVLLGRASLYGLACAGQAGVERALDILRSEIHTTLANLGCPSIAQLGPQYLHYSRATTGPV